ncbi:Protein CYPRO4 [Hibiscus syriacus]|uniref:Protein CYPRO4 n=1 Tax=Hibiscus syriacus TaxID=106335 RepID=A0A6A3BFU2_HIBSY|nr:Protein CYPRO4 [Hibiscus syriacus]
MGGSHSRDYLISDSVEEEYEEEYFEDPKDETPERSSSGRRPKTPSSVDEVEAKLKSLKLKYGSANSQNPSHTNAVKLYLCIGGNTPKAKWVTSEKLTTYSFFKTSKINDQNGGEDDEDSENEEENGEAWWVLKNTYGIESSDANKVKVYGKDFIGWAKPEAADDSIWEDAEDASFNSRQSANTLRENQDLREEFEEAANGGIQSLALGALDNSFLVGDSCIQVVKNFVYGVHGKADKLHIRVHLVTENGKQERHLVATEGLKSCYCYKIVLKDDSIIVDSRFMHDKFAVTDSLEAPLVIATPLKVSSFTISSKR